MRSRFPLFLGLVVLFAGTAVAQQNLTVPRASQHASVTQRVGLTDLTFDYHRPAVNDREVWGALVPWGQVWRAGANENTTFTTTSEITVGGQPLDAGTYGFHLIPNQNGAWTAIFSEINSAWGSFSYDESEDAARVSVTPRTASMNERLLYRFDDPTNTSVTAVMHWERVEVPIPISVNTPEVVLANMEREMRSLPRFSWQGWNQIATLAMQNDLRLNDALGWAEQSVSMNRNFTNVMTVASIKDKLGQPQEAETMRAEAMGLATENEMNAYGYQLLGQGRTADAVAIFRKNTEDHPESWNVWDSYGEGLAAQDNTAEAIEHYEKARSMAPQAQYARIDGVLAQLRGQN